MHFLVVVATVTTLTGCCYGWMPTTVSLVEERIAGGELASEGQFPFVVSLERRGKHSCGGSILNRRWILTAAHCIKTHAPEEMSIVAGTTNRTGGVRYNVTLALMHDAVWDADHFGNDIGLLKVTTDIQYSAVVQPVALHRGHIETGGWLTLCGWGRTHQLGHSVAQLHYIQLRTISTQRCQRMHRHHVSRSRMVCTLAGVGRGSCKGDSGSPLLWDGRVAAISSWGKLCGHGYPNVYTRVDYFLSWLHHTMHQYS